MSGVAYRQRFAAETTPLSAPGKQFLSVFRRLQRETGKLVPPRAALTMSACRGFVSHIGIFEVVGHRDVRARLEGRAVVSRTGIENTGENFFEICPEELRDPVWSMFCSVLDEPRGDLAFMQEVYERPLIVEVLALPFSDVNGVPRFVISASSPLDDADGSHLRKEGERMKIGEIFCRHRIDIG